MDILTLVILVIAALLFLVAYRLNLPEPSTPDVHEAIRGGVNVEVDDIAVSGDVVGRDVATHQFITYDSAFERAVGITNFVLDHLETIYKQTREQAQNWFRFSLIAAGAGFAVIAIGVIAVIAGQITSGIITAIYSVLPNAAAAFFFRQSKAANERVDSIQTQLAETREVLSAIEIVNTIDDVKSRDRLKAEIVRKMLHIEKKRGADAK